MARGARGTAVLKGNFVTYVYIPWTKSLKFKTARCYKYCSMSEWTYRGRRNRQHGETALKEATPPAVMSVIQVSRNKHNIVLLLNNKLHVLLLFNYTPRKYLFGW